MGPMRHFSDTTGRKLAHCSARAKHTGGSAGRAQRHNREPEQRQRIQSLEATLDQVIALERRELEVVAQQRVVSAEALFREGGGDVLDDRIRQIIADMKSAEDSLLRREREEQNRRRRTSLNVFVASVFLGFVIHFAVYYHLEREIGQRQLSESRLIHLNRLYAFLSQANQVIVRARVRDELFREVCRVAVEHGEFMMAWIGTPESDGGLIKPIAWWGQDDTCRRSSSISALVLMRSDPPEPRLHLKMHAAS
jgi:CHASE3 domain sensor protein